MIIYREGDTMFYLSTELYFSYINDSNVRVKKTEILQFASYITCVFYIVNIKTRDTDSVFTGDTGIA